MSHALVTEVLDHAPADLTALERLVLVVIAEAAQDDHRPGIPAREAWPSMTALTRRTGTSPRGVRAAMRRLAERGLDVRVRQGTDRHGEPVYAYSGHATRYRVPDLTRVREGGTPVPPLPGEGGAPVPPSADERGHHSDHKGALGYREGGTPVPPNQKEPEGTTPQPPARTSPAPTAGFGRGEGDVPRRPAGERAARTADDPRRADVEAELATLGTPEALIVDVATLALAAPDTRSSPLGRLRGPGEWRLVLEGEVARTRQREAEREAQRATRELTAQDQPPCSHGQPGGAHAMPSTGEPFCPFCRRDSGQPRAVAS